MTSRIFIDTVFVVALVNRRDQYHEQAVTLAERFDGHPLLVTDAVLLEIGNALSRNYKEEAVRIMDDFFASDEVKIVRLTRELFDKAYSLYKTYVDKEWSLVDCISFVVMRQEAVKQALTFDRHFAQAGFEVLMRELSPL